MTSYPMTNSMWVTLLYCSARQSHQSCDQQRVSGTALLICQAVSLIMSHPITNRKWVTDLLYFITRQSNQSFLTHPMTNREWVPLLYFFAKQSHQPCLIPWATVCEWHSFISLPVPSNSQQEVSGTTLFHCQAASLIVPHALTNSLWVTLLHFFSLINHVSYDQQSVCDTAFFLAHYFTQATIHLNQQIVSVMKFSINKLH